MTGVFVAGLRECFEDGLDVAGEFLAVGGQGDGSVRAGAQERGAGGVFELADLAVQGGALDADLAGGVEEAGLSGECGDPADALLGVRADEGVPYRWRNAADPSRLARGWARPFTPCRTGMPALRGPGVRFTGRLC